MLPRNRTKLDNSCWRFRHFQTFSFLIAILFTFQLFKRNFITNSMYFRKLEVADRWVWVLLNYFPERNKFLKGTTVYSLWKTNFGCNHRIDRLLLWCNYSLLHNCTCTVNNYLLARINWWALWTSEHWAWKCDFCCPICVRIVERR